MAEKIPAGAPPPPQHRVQRMDSNGDFVPVFDPPPIEETPALEPEAPQPLTVGEAITLAGRVLEIQSTQGGQTSVRVQLAEGAVWLQGWCIQRVTTEKEDRIAILEAEAADADAVIEALNKQVEALTRQAAKPQIAEPSSPPSANSLPEVGQATKR